MKREAQGDDLNGGFKTEYSNKVRLCVILQEDREEKEDIRGVTSFYSKQEDGH